MNEIEQLLAAIREMLPAGFRADISRRPERVGGLWLLTIGDGGSCLICVVWDQTANMFAVTRWAAASTGNRNQPEGTFDTRAEVQRRVGELLPPASGA